MPDLAHKLKNRLSPEGIQRARVARDFCRGIFDPFPYRAYMRKNKCIFIHVPKAAGTSMLELLGSRGPRDHATYREFLTASPTKFESYYKFGFVREPYDRFFSLYKYLRSGGNRWTTDLKFYDVISKYNMSIEDFSEYVAERKLNIINPLFWPQSCYIVNGEGEIVLDFLGRFENIEDDFLIIKEKLGLRGDLPKLNQGSPQNLSATIPDRAARLIEDMYDVDFSFLEYKKK